MDWTEESITRLRSLWQDGLSTAEIGRRMQITKNAVVGKAHRLTLPPRPSPIRKGLELASTGLQTQRTALDDEAGPMLAAPEPTPQRPIAIVTRAPPAVMQPTPAPVVAVPGRPVAPPAPVAGNVQVLRPSAGPATATPQQALPPRPSVRAEEVAPAPFRAVSAAPRRSGLTCCWPLGEPGTKEFHFCGGEPTPGKPYCAEHAAVAYVKLRDRRDSVA